MRASDPRQSRRRTVEHGLALLLCALLSGGAGAQQTPDQTAQALARAQSLLRQIAQEKATMEAEVAKLRADNARLAQRLALAAAQAEERTAALAAQTRTSAAVGGKLERTAARLAQTTDKLREVVARYKAQAGVLRATEAARDELAAQLAATQTELADAERKNLELYKTNKDILRQLSSETAWDRLLAKEPFTGLAHVQRETLVQGFEDRLYEQLREGNLEAASAE